MTTCPSCGAAAEKPRESFDRTHYFCGSYTYTAHHEWNHQSDLCRAWQTIRNAEALPQHPAKPALGTEL